MYIYKYIYIHTYILNNISPCRNPIRKPSCGAEAYHISDGTPLSGLWNGPSPKPDPTNNKT